MPTVTRWTLVGALVLAVAVAMPALAHDVLATIAQHGDDDGDGNRGHGNDADRQDGGTSGQEGEDGEPVVTAGDYTAEVECDLDDTATQCNLQANAPDDAAEVVRLVVPDAAVCAAVLDGSFERVASAEDDRLTGFASDEGDDDLSLEIAAAVTTGDTATYWVVTADGVVPATGPSLICETANTAPDATTAAVTAEVPAPSTTATAVPTTGTLLVAVSACADVPADTSAFDWFGQCQPGGVPHTFLVAPAGGGGASRTVDTDPDGEATFAELDPGMYDVDLVDASWCHAEADNVTTESDVVIEAGATTTVWIFLCDTKGTA